MEGIRRITSFTVDHRLIVPGMYVSRRDGNITTYDLRTRRPNAGDYMDDCTMHSVEHMFATYIRNSAIGQSIIYFGPMGCRTGFYLLVKSVPDAVVREEVIAVLHRIIDHNGEIFGCSEIECGNYRCLSLNDAKSEAERYLGVLESSDSNFEYPS